PEAIPQIVPILNCPGIKFKNNVLLILEHMRHKTQNGTFAFTPFAKYANSNRPVGWSRTNDFHNFRREPPTVEIIVFTMNLCCIEARLHWSIHAKSPTFEPIFALHSPTLFAMLQSYSLCIRPEE